jgi:PAS domain S-box-containing protein
MQDGQDPARMTSERDGARDADGLFRDSSERRRADEALRQERDFISAVLDTASTLVLVLDRQGRIVRFNRACERKTGYSFDEVKGKPLWDLFLIPEEVEPVKAVFEELRTGQFPNENENHWVSKHGERRLIAWSNTALLDADGTVEYVIGTGIDVTERRQAESQRDATLGALRRAHEELEKRVLARTAELLAANESLQQEIAERRRVESQRDATVAALRESEDHMRSLMESARSYAVYRIAVDPTNPFLARVLLASPSMKELLSISDLEDFSTWFDNIHRDDLARIVEANRCSLETGVPFEQQFRVFDAGRGEWAWVHVRSTPVFDDEGRLTHFNGLVVDVTEQKEAEAALRESEEKFRGIVEYANVGIAIVQDARFQFVNQYYASMMGYTVEELLGTEFMRYCTPDERDRIVDFYTRRVRGESVLSRYETAMVHKNGGYVYAEVSAGIIPYGGQQATFVFLRDITEQKRAEDALRQSELRFRAVFEGAPIGISVTSLEPRLLETNRALQQMFGYTGDEFYNLAVSEFSHPEDMAVDAALFNELVLGKHDGYQMEKRFIRKNGGMFWGRLSLSLVRGEQGEPLFAIATTEEITERKQAQQALKEAYQTLEKRVEERTRELSTLLEVSKNLGSKLELEPLLGSILDELWSVVDYEGCVVYALEGDELVARAHRGRTPRERAMSWRWGVDGPLDGLVLRSREAVLVSDTCGDSPEAQAYRESVGEMKGTLFPHIRSWLGVPLVARGQVIGELALDHSRPGFFTAAHGRFAMAFANQAAIAIENARLYEAEQNRREEAERRREVAEGLREILAVLNSRQSLNDMLDLIAAQACRVLGSDAAALLRLDKATGLLRIQATCRLDPEYAAQISMPLGVGTAGRALAERRPVVISDTAEAAAHLDAGYTDRPELVPGLLSRLVNRYSALFSVPIVVKDEAHGALTFYYREPHLFSEDEFRLALSVADQAALALESARLREQAGQAAAVEERDRLARELHDSVTQSLYSVTMYTEVAARLMTAGQEADASEYLREARDTAQEALREMRLMIYQLRPPILEKGGLAVALQVRLDAVERRGGIHAELMVEGEDRLPPAIQAELHQIAQEALNNTLKHAHAREVQVRLRFGDATTYLELEDDGVGFEVATVGMGGGLGLPGMKERVQKIGGCLKIESAAGQGTKVVVEVPTGGGE